MPPLLPARGIFLLLRPGDEEGDFYGLADDTDACAVIGDFLEWF